MQFLCEFLMRDSYAKKRFGMETGMYQTKMLVLDIDGTLTNSQKEITEETKKAIQGILERGHKVMLASGRPTAGMRRFEKELKLSEYGGYLLSFNGGRIIDCRSGEIIYQKTFPAVLVPGLFKFAKEHDCGLITYYGDQIICGTRGDEYIDWESKINGLPVTYVDHFLDYLDFDMNKLLMTAPPEQAQQYEKDLQKQFGDRISVYRSEPYFIELMPRGIDKAASIDRMLNTIGMKKEDIICCGDGFNDMTMIAYAGIGVAMENAQDAVKEKADYVTKSNDEDGIVHVIKRFMQD